MTTLNEPQDKLILYRGFPPAKKYVWSPFVTKLECRLRLSNLQYTPQEGTIQEGPLGKIPYVDVSPLTESPSRELIGDSSIIIDTLVQKGFAVDLNASLTPEQKVTDLGIRALCEDKLYFFNMAERWLDNYYTQRDHILQSKPWAVRYVIGNMIYNNVSSTLHGQGVGRYKRDEQRRMREEIWTVLEGLLKQRLEEAGGRKGPFWVLGLRTPTEADAVLFGCVNSVLVCDSCPESRAFVRGCASVMEYAGRIHDKVFAEYEKWVV